MKRLLSILFAFAAFGGVASAGDWTGPYAGIGVGRVEVTSPASLVGGGTTYGVHLGYDVDLGDFVFGGEMAYSNSQLSLGPGGARVDSIGQLKFKSGYDFGDTLGYFVLGGAQANTSSGDDTGVVFGVGLALGLTDNLTLSTEALRYEFNNFKGFGVDLNANSISLRGSFRF